MAFAVFHEDTIDVNLSKPILKKVSTPIQTHLKTEAYVLCNTSMFAFLVETIVFAVVSVSHLLLNHSLVSALIADCMVHCFGSHLIIRLKQSYGVGVISNGEGESKHLGMLPPLKGSWY